jgi:hypothetical protein
VLPSVVLDERDGAIVMAASRPDRIWHVPDGIGDYVAQSGEGLTGGRFEPGIQDFHNPEPCAEFCWTLGERVDAIARAGLVIERLREWPYANGCRLFSQMVDAGRGRWALPPGFPPMPLMYGLSARRT